MSDTRPTAEQIAEARQCLTPSHARLLDAYCVELVEAVDRLLDVLSHHPNETLKRQYTEYLAKVYAKWPWGA